MCYSVSGYFVYLLNYNDWFTWYKITYGTGSDWIREREVGPKEYTEL
jgi:hypothetical protein